MVFCRLYENRLENSFYGSIVGVNWTKPGRTAIHLQSKCFAWVEYVLTSPTFTHCQSLVWRNRSGYAFSLRGRLTSVSHRFKHKMVSSGKYHVLPFPFCNIFKFLGCTMGTNTGVLRCIRMEFLWGNKTGYHFDGYCFVTHAETHPIRRALVRRGRKNDIHQSNLFCLTRLQGCRSQHHLNQIRIPPFGE